MLPAEVPIPEVRPERPDLLLRLADGSIAHLEFQTTTDPGDLGRFYASQVAISQTFGCVAHTIATYGPVIASAPAYLGRGSAKYRVRNISLGKRDGEALVERLRARAAGEPWSARERVEAIQLPLMGRKRPLLAEVAEASAVLPVAERKDVLGSIVGLASNYLEAGQLLEVLRTMNAFGELVAGYLIKGRAEGMVEGRQQDVLRVLGKRFGVVPAGLAGRVAAVREAASRA